jgi:hypothetical protein
MQLDVRTDLRSAERYLVGLRKDQIPFATAYALTQTAKQAQENIRQEMRRVFDRPKPYTLNGTFIIPARKDQLFAVVKLKDGYAGLNNQEGARGTPDQYLRAQVKGGERKPKAFEKLLINRGLMPPGMYAIPTNAAPRDPFGNVSAGYFNRIMSQLRIATDPLSNATPASKKRRRTRTAGYFVAYPGRTQTKHLTPGIYERIGTGFGGAIRPIFIYTDSAPTYRTRLRFDQIVNRTTENWLRIFFEKGFKIAEATSGGTLAEQTNALFRAGISDYMGGTVVSDRGAFRRSLGGGS